MDTIVIGFVSLGLTVVASTASLAYWLGRRLTLLEQGQKRLEERVVRLEERVEKLEERIERLEARIDGLEARVDRLEARTNKLEERVGKLEGEVASLAREVSQLREEVRELGKRVDRLEARVEQEVSRLWREVADARGQLGRIEGRITRLQEAYTSYQEFMVEYLAAEGILTDNVRRVLLAAAKSITRVAKVNLLTEEEWKKIEEYLDKDPETFTMEEAEEFLELARKVVREYGEYSEAWKLHAYAAYVVGVTIRRLREEEKKRRQATTQQGKERANAG